MVAAGAHPIREPVHGRALPSAASFDALCDVTVAVSKVLHVIPSVAAIRGGPSTMVKALTQDLAREGLEVHVATTDDDGPGILDVTYDAPVRQDGVTYWYFPRQSRFYTFSWPLTRWLS